jgi:hypothetical protein
MSLGFMILAPQIQQSGLIQIKSARARAVMNTQEMKIRAVLMEQSTYQNCSAATRSQCALNPQKMAPFQFVRVPGCAGQPSVSCGVQLMSVNFNNSNLTFTGTLHYSGNDVAIHDSVINFSLPPEVLQDKQISCPSGSPFSVASPAMEAWSAMLFRMIVDLGSTPVDFKFLLCNRFVLISLRRSLVHRTKF